MAVELEATVKLALNLKTMINQNIYYLETPPNARFHFGEVSEESSLSSSSSICHSDTLFGAIMHNAFAKDLQQTENLLVHFEKEEIAISSAMFYVQQTGRKIIFFPKPISLDFIEASEVNFDLKKLKNVKMLSKGVVEKGLSPEDWFDFSKCRFLQGGEFVCLKNELDSEENFDVYQKMVTQKVPLSYTDNKEDERKIYYQTDVFLPSIESMVCGYYFLLKHTDKVPETILTFLEECIHLIKNFGLGGDRSTGAGEISSITKEQFSWKPTSEDHQLMTLSLLTPKEDNYRNGQYRITKRGGQKLNENQRLDFVHCILEGAVFPEAIAGQILEIGPTNLKYGKPYFLPLPRKKAEL